MLEEIKLYGTLLKTVKLQRNSDFNRTSYLTYDSSYRKFYFLIYGSNHRFIAVADDLPNMFKSVEETFITMIDSEF